MATRRRQINATATGINAAPPEFAEWFAGRRPVPITAFMHPYFDALPELWADYLRRVPDAPPPPGVSDHEVLRQHLGLDPVEPKAPRRRAAAR